MATAPSFTLQPISAAKMVGESYVFTVAVSGTAPITLQWQKDDEDLPGQTALTYTISEVAVTDSGVYTCIATNGTGTATSNSATLRVRTRMETYKKAFVDWVKQVTGLPEGKVLWDKQDMPRPARPYLTLDTKVFNNRNMGMEYQSLPNAEGKASIVSNKELTLSVNWYATRDLDPVELLVNLQDSLGIGGIYSILQSKKIAFVRTLMGPSDVTIQRDTQWETHGALDLLFRMPWVVTDSDVGFIEKVSAEGEVFKIEGVKIDTLEVEVTKT